MLTYAPKPISGVRRDTSLVGDAADAASIDETGEWGTVADGARLEKYICTARRD